MPPEGSGGRNDRGFALSVMTSGAPCNRLIRMGLDAMTCKSEVGARDDRLQGCLLLSLGISVMVLAGVIALLPARLNGVELCSRQGKTYMREAKIGEDKIKRACALASRQVGLLTLKIHRTQDELGYCRVTLILKNNSLVYLNILSLTSAESRFEIFRFSDLLPGATEYAAAKSRILMDCDELEEITLAFHWPASLRMGDKALQGSRLRQYKPILLSRALRWNR